MNHRTIHESIFVVTPPTFDPLTLADAKEHLRITEADEDFLIQSIVSSTRERIENDTRRAVCTQTLRMKLDRFPRGYENHFLAATEGSFSHRISRNAILIPRPPVQSVTSIQYIDTNGVVQTLDPSAYLVDLESEPGRITPVYGTSWPLTLPQIGAVIVTYVAGWTETNMPATVKLLSRLWLSHAFENREPIVLDKKTEEMPLAIQSLTMQLRFGDYA